MFVTLATKTWQSIGLKIFTFNILAGSSIFSQIFPCVPTEFIAFRHKESIDLRQSYTRVVKQLSNLQRFKGTKHGPKLPVKPIKKYKS
jgi:ribosomal protein S13